MFLVTLRPLVIRIHWVRAAIHSWIVGRRITSKVERVLTLSGRIVGLVIVLLGLLTIVTKVWILLVLITTLVIVVLLSATILVLARLVIVVVLGLLLSLGIVTILILLLIILLVGIFICSLLLLRGRCSVHRVQYGESMELSVSSCLLVQDFGCLVTFCINRRKRLE